MISFDLRCGRGHVFEGWFRTTPDYEAQSAAGAIACPLCGSIEIAKAVMAPAVAAKANRRGAARPGAVEAQPAAPSPAQFSPAQFSNAGQAKAMLEALARDQAKMLEQSQWVGDRFAERARAMHYGEAEHAPIHGTANMREAREMIEEGLAVAPLLVPTPPPESTH